MTTETDGNKNQGDTVSKADFDKVKDQMQTWMGKATDLEKKLNGRSLDSLIAAAEERDILAAQAAGSDPSKIQSEIERAKNGLREELGRKLDEKDSLISRQASQLKEMTVVDSVVKQAGDKIYKNAADDFRSYVRTHCDLDEDGNTIIVKDDKGNVRYNGAKKMTVDELITELESKRDHWFTNRTAAGGHDGGNKGSAATGEKVTTWAQLSKLSPEQSRVELAKLSLPERRKILGEARAAGVQI